MNAASLILPFGVLTYLLVLFNVLSGHRIIKIHISWHRRMGYVALLAASTHLGFVLYYKLFV
ncbi:MAG: hypothetical protein A3K19_09000 [Lentisphaerae bacterium RIFOXYB12_FULL_65_16]|nr:MAG: hypothetical protein A3K18_11980 [Lentisphaerae bacterium RIFOXYA12_64_32]OGV90830.1 MAG: hypothetical protein A3K19_09000 [Lentisphaerae bacterium RIFOXYB12_FULL_65_16]